jgi:hypothetical protein
MHAYASVAIDSGIEFAVELNTQLAHRNVDCPSPSIGGKNRIANELLGTAHPDLLKLRVTASAFPFRHTFVRILEPTPSSVSPRSSFTMATTQQQQPSSPPNGVTSRVGELFYSTLVSLQLMNLVIRH